MRIISKHADYYDSVMAQGQDRSLLYLRECVAFGHEQFSGLRPELKVLRDFMDNAVPRHFNTNKPSKDFHSISAGFGLVLLAGKLYPYAEVSRRRRDEITPKSSVFVYDKKEMTSLLKEHDIDINKKLGHGVIINWRLGEYVKSIGEFFDLAGDERWHEHCTEHKLPLISYSRSPDLLVLNIRLAEVQFFRRMVGFQVHQELSMFLGNIAAPDRIPVVIEDKYRIPQHGFDKHSFRKRPAGT